MVLPDQVPAAVRRMQEALLKQQAAEEEARRAAEERRIRVGGFLLGPVGQCYLPLLRSADPLFLCYLHNVNCLLVHVGV